MSIRIVTHCYARELPHYSTLLRFQLSSLILHSPRVPTSIDVWYCTEDVCTVEVVQQFMKWGDIRLRPCILSPEELGRRAIGRNTSAHKCEEGLVWFTDVDHVFGEGCLDELWRIWSRKTVETKPIMVFPRVISIHKDHELGDRKTEEGSKAKLDILLDIDTADFSEKRYKKAIGGVQIVDGTFARKYGYLHGTKWMEPRRDGRLFGDFHDDIAFRSHCSRHGCTWGIDLPNLYRLRHSRTSYQ